MFSSSSWATTIMLACEGDTSGFRESPTAPWVALASSSQKGGGSLAALAGLPISSRFCSWKGRSGRRYVFSVYPARECPAFCDAILLAAVRDLKGRRRVLSVRETGAFPEPAVAEAQRELTGFGPAAELHVHLLARSPEERAAAVADLVVVEDR
jgi:hypothetical protein